MYKKYIYSLSEDELGEILVENPVSVEIIKRVDDKVDFATFKPLKGLKPVRIEELDESWKEWKKGFGPVDVEDFVVIPPWKKPVYIKPGMAFGTGLHPTTKLCIRILKDFVEEGASVLDIGTGSGILAIVSKLLGAKRVVGIDISKDAVRECKENAKLNGVEVECYHKTPSEVKEKFDIVVANLELSIFRKELSNITKLFTKKAIFSGIYTKDELEEFMNMLEHEGLKADRILEDENWFCVVAGDARN